MHRNITLSHIKLCFKIETNHSGWCRLLCEGCLMSVNLLITFQTAKTWASNIIEFDLIPVKKSLLRIGGPLGGWGRKQRKGSEEARGATENQWE